MGCVCVWGGVTCPGCFPATCLCWGRLQKMDGWKILTNGEAAGNSTNMVKGSTKHPCMFDVGLENLENLVYKL